MQHDKITSLACCQLVTTIEDKLSTRIPTYEALVDRISMSGMIDFDEFRKRLNHNTIEVVRRITKVCVRDGINLLTYKEKLYEARDFDLDKIVDLAIVSEYFDEVVVAPLEMVIVGRVMEL
jgi:hypothetical protein